MSAECRTIETLVIGGGLAGSMTGLRLAAAGRDVAILERERTAHHKVCGEFLSPEAIEYLDQAGIHPLDLGAETIRVVRLTCGRRMVECDLPFTALSLSRCVLDEASLARAAAMGCVVRRGAFVETLVNQQGSWRAQLRGESSPAVSLNARTVFLANGKHDLRGIDRTPAPQNDLVGFKLHWRLTPQQTQSLRGSMDLYLFPGGYGGLSLVENNVANFCLVVRRSTLRHLGGWAKLLASIQRDNPHIASRLSGASPLWERPLAVSSIPYGYLAGRPMGLWCVGDQAAVIPSFTGDGMSIALHSATLAAQIYLSGESSEHYHAQLKLHLRRSMRLATALSRVMVTGFGRSLASIGLSAFPGTLSLIAKSTRVPDKALNQTRAYLHEQHTSALS